MVLQQPLEVSRGEWVRLSIRLNKSIISIIAAKEKAGANDVIREELLEMDSFTEACPGNTDSLGL